MELAFTQLTDTLPLQLILLLALSLLLGQLAFQFNRPRFIGAILAGFLLSPAIFGQLAPDLHRKIFLGGTQTLQQINTLDQNHQKDIQAYKLSGVTPEAITIYQDQYNLQREKLTQQLNNETQTHTKPLQFLISFLILPLLAFTLFHKQSIPQPLSPPIRPTQLLKPILLIIIATGAFVGVLAYGLIHYQWLENPPPDLKLYLIALILIALTAEVPHALRKNLNHTDHFIAEKLAKSLSLLALIIASTFGTALYHHELEKTFLYQHLVAHLIFAIILTLLLIRYAPLLTLPWRTMLYTILLAASLYYGPPQLILCAALIGLYQQRIDQHTQTPFSPNPSPILLFAEALICSYFALQTNFLTDFDWLLFLILAMGLADVKIITAASTSPIYQHGFTKSLLLATAATTAARTALPIIAIFFTYNAIDQYTLTNLLLALFIVGLLLPPCAQLFAEMEPQPETPQH